MDRLKVITKLFRVRLSNLAYFEHYVIHVPPPLRGFMLSS
jgi:hypothetical protein